jgi:hypothetical protein
VTTWAGLTSYKKLLRYLIRGVAYGERGLIRGMAYSERGLIRGMAYGERGLIRGGYFTRPFCT